MTRAALALLPTLQCIEPGRDAYVSALTLSKLAQSSGRFWTFDNVTSTVEMPEHRYAKNYASLSEHALAESTFHELIREYSAHGVPRPVGYADVFHKLYKTPRVKWTFNRLFSSTFRGGWEAALLRGVHQAHYRKYDIRSAYLWAGSLGLPDPATYRYSRAFGKLEGLYRVRLARLVHSAPFPFNSTREVSATAYEIALYDLPIERIYGGVTWAGYLDPAPMLAALNCVSTWKQAGRCYWGRWAQVARVSCHCPANTWALPNIAANLIWSHMVVSRVRERLWNVSAGAVHVFTDSVITRDVLPTGPNIGDWKLETDYPLGVAIKNAGCYGPAKGEWEKAAGISALRREDYKRQMEQWADRFALDAGAYSLDVIS